jgi:predicted lipoprotein with Yx(FWY)xxD motif
VNKLFSLGSRRLRALTGLLGALVATAALTGAALAASTLTVGSAKNSTLDETVVVNAAGHTLYSLSGESAHHLLCKSVECAHVWPPLTVPSKATHLKAAAGVHGAVGLLRRPNGSMQVTLRGKPLYRFSGDSGRAQAAGQGIQSFGGTWNAVAASASTPAPAPAPAPAPMSGESTPPYGY